MDLTFLAINVGNTRTQLGTFIEGKLERNVALANAAPQKFADAIGQAIEPIRASQPVLAIMASVNSEVDQMVGASLRQQKGVSLKRLEQDVPIPVGRQLDPETIVGEDRLLNAAAAYDVLKQACVVVDAGTALTIDFVDGAGTFHGGAIAPGAQLMLDSLHEHTSQLPEVRFAAPVECIGRNTTEAMRSAVFHGIRGIVRELVERFAETAGGYPMVVATGGDADTLFQDYELVDRIVPELTLLGFAVTVRSALQKH